MSSKKTDYLKMHDWTEADPWRLAEVSENFKKMDKKAKDLDSSMAATVSAAADAKTTATGIDAKATDALTKSTEAVQNVSTAVQKANSAETKATEAKTVSDNALAKAGAAESIANGVQTQFNQVVIAGDSSVEAAQARVNTSGQTYSTLKQRLDSEHQEVTVKLAEKATKAEVQEVASGAPKLTYTSLSLLQSAYPTGSTSNALITDNGHIYTWNGSAWIDTGILYQSVGIAKASINLDKLSVAKPKKNLFNPNELKSGYYLNETGGEVAAASYYISEFIEVLPNQPYFYARAFQYFVFYNDSKQVISSALANGATGTITTPANTKYLRMNSYSVYASTATMLTIGSTAIPYEPYSPYIPKTHLEKTFEIADIPAKSITPKMLDNYVKLKGESLFNPNVLASSKTLAYNKFNEMSIHSFFEVKGDLDFDYIFFKTLKGTGSGSVNCVISFVKGTTITDFTGVSSTTGTIEADKLARITISSPDISGFILADWTTFLEFYGGTNWFIENETIGSIYRVNPNSINRKAISTIVSKGELPPPTYSDMHKKMPNFTKRYYAKDRDVTVVMAGDSISISSTNYVTEKTASKNRPPLTHTNNLAGELWDKLKWDGQTYHRFDDTGIFTESGIFTTIDTVSSRNGTLSTEWDENSDAGGFRPTINRYSESVDASVSWSIPANHRRSGFIFRSEPNGSGCSLAITQGTGHVEVWNGSAWVEANGYVFSTIESKASANHSVSVYQKRLKLRCVEANIGIAKTVKVQKLSGLRLTYWGIEHGLDDHMFYFINAARGSHSHSALWQHVQNEIYDLKPDLILYQIPVMNDISPSFNEVSPPSYGIDILRTHAFDLTNPMSVASKSNGFTDIDVIFYLPWFSSVYDAVDSSGNWKYFKNSHGVYSVRDYYNAYVSFFLDNPEHTLINTWDRLIVEAKRRGTLFDMVQSSSKTGATFTVDGTHLNDLGSSILTKYMLPCFDFIDI